MTRQLHDQKQIERVRALADRGLVERIVIDRNGLIGCSNGYAITYAEEARR